MDSLTMVYRVLIKGEGMIQIFIYLIALCVFVSAPLPLQILFFILNFLISDPIPVLDEAFMAASIIKKLAFAERIVEFAEENPQLFKVILAGIGVGFIVLIYIY